MKKTSFGVLPSGEEIFCYELENGQGMRVRLINYGATIVGIDVPGSDGSLTDVVLGFDALDGYLLPENPYFGACCGRVANRLAGGWFELNGEVFEVSRNAGENMLHGGFSGFDKKVWRVAELDDGSLQMSYCSSDGEEGFPGNLEVTLVYSLTESNELCLAYRAETDRDTLINLTNHAYFNLAGSGTVLGHDVQVLADRYTVTGEDLVPTGEVAKVAGTPLDLREMKPVGAQIAQLESRGFDHNYCLKEKRSDEVVLAARVSDPGSGRWMECYTSEPGVQLYTANYLGVVPGKSGMVYRDFDGLCLEAQGWPDAIHHPNFPTTVLRRGEVYTQTTRYRFGAA
jgi:aldose 1-epimerase